MSFLDLNIDIHTEVLTWLDIFHSVPLLLVRFISLSYKRNLTLNPSRHANNCITLPPFGDAL